MTRAASTCFFWTNFSLIGSSSYLTRAASACLFWTICRLIGSSSFVNRAASTRFFWALFGRLLILLSHLVDALLFLIHGDIAIRNIGRFRRLFALGSCASTFLQRSFALM
jgi:hypothetical protein